MAKRKRTYGTGAVVPPAKPGGLWGIRLREGTRRPYIGGLPSREHAERMLAVIAGQAAAGRTGVPLDPKTVPTIGELRAVFLQRRARTHRAAAEDRGRWDNHIGPFFDHLRPAEVNAASIRAFTEAMLAKGLASGTVRILVALLSALYTDLVEQGVAQANPARNLPRATRRLLKPSHDPRTTPFIEKLDDVLRIYLDLPKPLNVAYAIGALAGLRTGEVFALKWSHIDLDARRIHVRESVKGPLKDSESRIVPILDGLYPVLAKAKLELGGDGLVVPPMRVDGDHINKATPGKYLAATLAKLKLERPGLGWYEATRHTFASQWVLNNGSIEKLKEIMGHYSVVVTERYAHLRPDLFAQKDLGTIPLSFAKGTGQFVAKTSPRVSAAKGHVQVRRTGGRSK